MASEVVDQAAHFVVGAALVVVFSLVVPRWAAFILLMFLATLREVIQHKGFDFGSGSVLDLAFFALGGLLAWLVLLYG